MPPARSNRGRTTRRGRPRKAAAHNQVAAPGPYAVALRALCDPSSPVLSLTLCVVSSPPAPLCWQRQGHNVSAASLSCVRQLPGFPAQPVLHYAAAPRLVECLRDALRADQLCLGLTHDVAFVAEECGRSARSWQAGIPGKKAASTLRSWRSLESFLNCVLGLGLSCRALLVLQPPLAAA